MSDSKHPWARVLSLSAGQCGYRGWRLLLEVLAQGRAVLMGRSAGFIDIIDIKAYRDRAINSWRLGSSDQFISVYFAIG